VRLHISIWGCFLILAAHVPAQEASSRSSDAATPSTPSVWEAWDPDVARELYTSRDISYLGEEEKKVILFMNMARHDGSLFASTFLEQYVQENQMDETSYLKSLRKDLKKVSGLQPLIPEDDLFRVARDHAEESGRTGHVGHKRMEKRFAHLAGNPYMAWGENCSYGYDQAIAIVITLLIDEDWPSLGHRKNILKPEYNSVGVAIRPHKTYRTNCVMDFGKKSRSDLNSVPY
jgi:uncharacterized protein YkwD